MYFVIHKLPIFVPMINILIIEDQPMFRDSIATQLDMQPDFQVTGKVASYGDGIQFIKEHPETDIVVMEPGNFITADYSVIESIQQNPDIEIVLLSQDTLQTTLVRLIHTGAKGLVSKQDEMDDLISCIRAVQSGKFYLSASISKMAVDMLKKSIPKMSERTTTLTREMFLQTFTPKEVQILKMISQGFSSQEIADNLSLARRTVESHKANMLLKSKTRNTAALVMYGIRKGLLKA